MRQLPLSIVVPGFRPAVPTDSDAVLVTVTSVVPFPLNEAGKDVDASSRTDPVVSEPVIVQVAVTLAGGSVGDSVTEVGESEQEPTVPDTVVASANIDCVETSWLVFVTSNGMSAVPTVTDCDGFTGTTDTPYTGFAVTVTFTDPLSVVDGYSLYVAVNVAEPLPTVVPL